MASIAFPGGLDVQGIVSQLIALERAPEQNLNARRSALSRESSALASFEANLKNLDSSLAQLTGPSALGARSVATSDASVSTASAASGSQAGTYALTVTTLASTAALASVGSTSLATVLPHGSFAIKVGSAAPVTVAVGDGSDTLETLRDEINASGAQVQASVLYDGSKYRLSLTSKVAGAAGATAVQDVSSNPLQAALGFAGTSQARDADFRLNGLRMTRPTNQVTDAVAGLNLDLHVDGGATAVITVSEDVEQQVASIRKFVDSYNTLTAQMRDQLAKKGGDAGPLADLTTVRALMDKLKQIVSRSVQNIGGTLSNLRQAGMELQDDGSMTLDEAKLNAALASGDIGDLFGVSTSATDARVSVAAAPFTPATGAYDVVVTAAAERATATGSEAIAEDGLAQDETLTFTQGTATVSVDLDAGATLGQVVATLNDALAAGGIDVTAADDGSGKLKLTSLGFGSAAKVDVTSSTDAAGSTGVGTAGLHASGVDVAGTIDGHAATGSGRRLAVTSGALNGLSLEIRARASDVSPAGTSLGKARVAVGAAEAMRSVLAGALRSNTGTIARERTTLSQRDKLLSDRIDQMERHLAQRQDLLTRQLTRADEALRRMSTLSSTLSAQISRLGG